MRRLPSVRGVRRNAIDRAGRVVAGDQTYLHGAPAAVAAHLRGVEGRCGGCLLSAEFGEMPSTVQAASWLEIKRTYMALRPRLRRIYAALRDEAAAAFAPVMTTLGFKPVARLDLGEEYNLAVNDFGPQSVDGWLARRVAAEIGIDASAILDREAHEAVIDGRRVPLTKLELAVFDYLQSHANRAVSRASLLENVWGYSYTGGSNVVDVVIRSLRKKLGERSAVIETVSGVGYRVRELATSRSSEQSS